MINVKGTKNALPEPDTSQRYVLKSGDEVSRTPLVIGGLLMGIAAYLGSIFSWGREPEPPSQTKSGDTDAELLETAEPVVTTAESQTPAEEDLRTASPRRSQDDLSGPKSFSAAMPPVDDAPRSIPLRYSGESGNMPWVAGRASENVGDERMDRIASGAGTPPADIANPAGNRPPLDGDDPTGTESPPDDDPSVADDDPTDVGDPGYCDPLEPESDDDDDEMRPDGNRAPRVSGPVYLLDVAPCVALLIAFDDLLSKAEDPDGDVLSVQNLSVSSGELTEVENGWVFQSGTGQPGPVTLSYEITDGELTIDAIAHFSVVKQPVIAGTAANDTLLGSMCADEINGAGGDDNIDGRAGNDVINGGAGDDHIIAGDGDDVVFGGDGNDIIFGGAGNDHLFGGTGDDRLFGGDGDDVIFGNAGEDFLSGGDGDDLLLGGDGNDVIMDGAGRDRVFGGMGNDRIVAALDADDDVYDGGGGTDTLDYSHATERLVVDLVNGVVSGVEIGHDFITGFEKVLGGRGADQFIFGAESVALTGGAGDDVFVVTSAGGDRPNPVSHVIMDFGVGDRIRISEYDIFWNAGEPEDRFEQIYRDDDGDDLPIRYRHDRDDGSEWTVIETNFDDDMWATAVTLQGTHKLSWSTERNDSHEWLS
ncbi:calcium-binding protein [Vreelandella arctica]|uniref:calcium-binding protein n=1 Tax=Vreelandella arctica TaxID=3126499 RepID=UPI00300E541A